MDGIEVHEQYITPVHNFIYNSIIIGEAVNILSNNNLYYELILALDIVEHFTKREGLEFIKLCRNRADTVLINTPNIYFQIDKEFYNQYMSHNSGWDADDFINLGAKYVWHSGINVLAVFTEKNFNLPEAKIIGELNNQDIDLIKVKELINMYHETSQFQDCIKACEKYLNVFPDDKELLKKITICNEKLAKSK